MGNRKENALKKGIRIIRTKEEKSLLGQKKIRTSIRCGMRTVVFYEDGSSKEISGDWE